MSQSSATSEHNTTVIMTSPTHHHLTWHPESLCGVSRNQLTSTVNGENPGSRPRWTMHTSWTTPQSDNRALLFLDNNGLSWTVSAPDKVTTVPVRRNGNFQDSDQCSCGETQTMSHIVESCPQTRLHGGLSKLQTMMPLPGWPVMAPNAYDNNNWDGRLFHTGRPAAAKLVLPKVLYVYMGRHVLSAVDRKRRQLLSPTRSMSSAEQRCQVFRFRWETPVFRHPLRPPVWQDLSPVFTFYLWRRPHARWWSRCLAARLPSAPLFTYLRSSHANSHARCCTIVNMADWSDKSEKKKYMQKYKDECSFK